VYVLIVEIVAYESDAVDAGMSPAAFGTNDVAIAVLNMTPAPGRRLCTAAAVVTEEDHITAAPAIPGADVYVQNQAAPFGLSENENCEDVGDTAVGLVADVVTT
jgi:hypothetical protein